MAKRSPDTDTAVAEYEQPAHIPELTRSQAREHFINKCLHTWGLEQFIGERGCKPEPGHVDSLVEKAGRLFDRLFEKRPITPNLR